jgi:hypothetical protein
MSSRAPTMYWTSSSVFVSAVEEARRAHEMLGEGGVLGKIVLLPNG